LDKEILKISKLCQHWADHNDSHKTSFLKWRNVAESKGLRNVVENLDKAIQMMDECTKYLLLAQKELR